MPVRAVPDGEMWLIFALYDPRFASLFEVGLKLEIEFLHLPGRRYGAQQGSGQLIVAMFAALGWSAIFSLKIDRSCMSQHNTLQCISRDILSSSVCFFVDISEFGF